jgi:hypothetical protein
MEFRIADTFTDSLARLTAQEQKAAKTTAFDLQLDPTSNGLSVHKLDRAKDANFWSVRVNADARRCSYRQSPSPQPYCSGYETRTSPDPSEEAARERASERLGSQTLLTDINDVLVWLSFENSGFDGDLFVDRFRRQRWTMTIARALIYHDDLAIRDGLTMQAEAAFGSLGWVFDSDGNSEEEWFGSK